MSLLMSSLLLLVLVAAVLSPPVTGQATVAWSQDAIDQARRGQACASPRYITNNTYQTASLGVFYTGGAISTGETSSQYLQNGGLWTFSSTGTPMGSWSAREGHFLHVAHLPSNYYSLVQGTGTNGNSLNFFNTMYENATAYWKTAASSASPAPLPLTATSWNWTTTPWIDTLHDNLYVMVLYGGWYVDGSPPYAGHFSNQFFIAEANLDVQVTDTITTGIASPFPNARHGLAMAGFNATQTNPARGALVVMGGWDEVTATYYNDVWIASTARTTGTWSKFSGNAPWARRWGSQLFDGGRMGIFLYGGYPQSGDWINDVWYAQFPANPFSSTNQPTWSSITQTGGGPAYEPSCSCAFWSSPWTLNLVMMGYRTQDAFNIVNGTSGPYTPPTVVLYHGAVTYTPTEGDEVPQAIAAPEETFLRAQPIDLLDRFRRHKRSLAAEQE